MLRMVVLLMSKPIELFIDVIIYFNNIIFLKTIFFYFFEPLKNKKKQAILLFIAYSVCYFINTTHEYSIAIFKSWEVIFTLFILVLCFEKNCKLKIYVTLLVGAILELVIFISFSFQSFIYRIQYGVLEEYYINKVSSYIELSDNFSFFIYVIIYTIVLQIISRKIIKQFPTEHKHLTTTECSFLTFSCIIGILITIILRFLVFLGGHTLFKTYYMVFLLILAVSVILLLMIYITIALFNKMHLLYSEQKEKAVMQQQINHIQEHLKAVDELYDTIRFLKHDMKNHIGTLKQLLLDKSNIETANEYLNKIETSIHQNNTTFSTGNPVIDVILEQKCKEMDGKKIKHEIIFGIPKGQHLDFLDISVVLNNALDNAVEAAKLEQNAYVSLHSTCKGSLFFIDIENTCTKHIVIDKFSGLPITTKADNHLHGIGLKNIQKIAKKYQGDIEIQTSNNKFLLTIMLKIQ